MYTLFYHQTESIINPVIWDRAIQLVIYMDLAVQ